MDVSCEREVMLRGSQALKVGLGIFNGPTERGNEKFLTRFINLTAVLLSYVLPHKIVYCASSSRDVHEKLGYCCKRSMVVPNGIDVSSLYPDRKMREKFRTVHSIGANQVVIGHVGRFHPTKDYRKLAETIAALSCKLNFKVILFGKDLDAKNETLKNLFHKFNVLDKIELLGSIDDVLTAYNGMDLFLLTSKVEALPTVITESMLCEVPCVSTDVGDVREIIGTHGWIAKNNSAIELANCLSEAIKERTKSAKEWETCKKECRQHIKDHYDIVKMARTYEQLWDKL